MDPERPIVLLHGWGGFCSSLLPLELHLRRHLRRPVVRLDLGLGFGCIRVSAARAAEAIERVLGELGGRKVDVVGHSMGGLVAAYALKHLDGGRRIRSVVTLGTPHRGAPLARAAALLLGRVSASLRQMLPGSELVLELARSHVPRGSRLVSLAGLDDTLVPAPWTRLGRRGGQHNRDVAGVDHFGLLIASRAHRSVENALRGQSPA
jgi:pimeloyl-ACP methyl ester carboxylesterase